MSLKPTVTAAIRLVHSVDDNAEEAARIRSKETKFKRPRYLMWAILREHAWSYPKIAHNTGGYDHTTIMNGVRRAHEIHGTALIERLAADLPEKIVQIRSEGQVNLAKRVSEHVKQSDSLKLPTDPKWALKVLKSELREQVSQ